MPDCMGRGLELAPSDGGALAGRRPVGCQARDVVGQVLNIGIVGCGTISAAYLKTFPRLAMLKLVAVADLDFSRAQAIARTDVRNRFCGNCRRHWP